MGQFARTTGSRVAVCEPQKNISSDVEFPAQFANPRPFNA